MARKAPEISPYRKEASEDSLAQMFYTEIMRNENFEISPRPLLVSQQQITVRLAERDGGHSKSPSQHNCG